MARFRDRIRSQAKDTLLASADILITGNGKIIVAHSQEINLTSLGLLQGELVAEIENAAAKLERFVQHHDDADLLQGCIGHIESISGSLSLIQLSGANLLASEILQLAREITPGEMTELLEQQLDVMSESFFILPRYLEYVHHSERGMPSLLIESINRLRKVRGAPPLPECHFFELDQTQEVSLFNGRGASILAEDLPALIRRLRHMYQVGLLNLFKQYQPRAALGMMQRAAERLEIISGEAPMGNLWTVCVAGIESLKLQGVSFPKSRLQVLSVIDRQIKLSQAEGLSAFNREPPKALIKMLIYWSALNDKPSARSQTIQEMYGYSPLNYNALELDQETESLRGPNASTVASVAAVLKDELGKTKTILEAAAQASPISSDDFDTLKEQLSKIAEILSVVGLTTPSQTLRQEVEKIEGWQGAEHSATRDELLEIADSMLYAESSVSDLESLKLSDEKLHKANLISREQVISNSQLKEALGIALNESEMALSMIKRALSSFSESNYDFAHIKNVGASLDGVRGAMFFMGFHRAEAVIISSRRFVNDLLAGGTPSGAITHMLETFADAVISLEYFLDAARIYRQPDESVLQVAEESLGALGYPVSSYQE